MMENLSYYTDRNAGLGRKDARIGVYVHVPFCRQKCPYCDFYSQSGTADQMDAFVEAVQRDMRRCALQHKRGADTLYFGGGTPSLLGEERLSRLIASAKECFGLEAAEITVEVNPTSDIQRLAPFFHVLGRAGANRISMGMQSANQAEVKALGRSHTPRQVEEAVWAARQAGISNLSLDLMLAVPYQTKESLLSSISFCDRLNIPHVSAYLLKVEPGTAFYQQRDALSSLLPDEDGTADLYLFAVEQLERRGYRQYEISNFAKEKDGLLLESRHNMKYWKGEEYLGFGPAAHSFLDGRRFYYPRDLAGYLAGNPPIGDGSGGGEEEAAMLALRTKAGLTSQAWMRRFGRPLPQEYLRRAKRFVPAGLVEWLSDGSGFRFTPQGFLVSNALLAAILWEDGGSI